MPLLCFVHVGKLVKKHDLICNVLMEAFEFWTSRKNSNPFWVRCNPNIQYHNVMYALEKEFLKHDE